jgi:hypothetical protein
VRRTMVRMTLVGFAAVALAGCANETATSERTVTQTAPLPEHTGSMFVHVVVFDLKPDTPEAVVNDMIQDAYRVLAKVPSVRKISSGRRDPRMQREVSDTNFSVGLVVFFDDKEGHDLYSGHPLHQEYVGKYGGYAAKVRVFDFTAPAK